MSRTKKLLLTILLSASIFCGLVSLSVQIQTTPNLWAQGDSLSEKLRTFRLILETIQRNYVDVHSEDELLEAAIHGMLESLDPHTAYLPPDNFQRWNRSFEGFSGIGVMYDIIGNYPMITGIMKDSPASQVPLETGDLIMAIDGKSTLGMSRQDIAQTIYESPASNISLTIYRGTSKQTQKLTLPRTHLTIPSISAAYMLDEQAGYIALDRFTGLTARELDSALDNLSRMGMRSLILDMRDNGGGYLSAAVDVADRFLPRGKLIVYTRGRDASANLEYRANGYHTMEDLPLVVLINHGTASAAEIVAGALQDWDRALIIGTTSFGKGLVQSQFRFQDGSALLVTTSRYYTPAGRMIQRDYTNLTKDAYYRGAYVDLDEAEARGDVSGPAYHTPLGRVVYGGGGIRPDVWVDNKASVVPAAIRRLYISEDRIITRFASKLISEHPEWRNLQPRAFRQFQIAPASLSRFENFVLSNCDYLDRAQIEQYAPSVQFLLQREVAQLAAGEEGRFWANFEIDRQLQVARDTLSAAGELMLRRPLAQVYGQRAGAKE